jgi:uncharacterized protein (TIGR00255 family)
MLYSMTGYGIAKTAFAEETVSVEIRSLNSKSFDLRLRVPNAYNAYELDLRKLLQNELQRGKIDVNINIESALITDFKINQPLLSSYISQLKEAAAAAGIAQGDILQTAARLPNITINNEINGTEGQWKNILSVCHAAIVEFAAFRAQEGQALEDDIRQRVQNIAQLLADVAPFEPQRAEIVQQRLRQQLEQLGTKIDENRFEQELIYYLEKYDISEEKTRLRQHCLYFMEELNAALPTAKGTKLAFISQEMGREINTLGSKANLAEMQRVVINMKDELEKIKEQLANIL